MGAQLDSCKEILNRFLAKKAGGGRISVEREEVVAHATLSALVHHWPARAPFEIRELLRATEEIKQIEHSRWMTQRRISIAKLSRVFHP